MAVSSLGDMLRGREALIGRGKTLIVVRGVSSMSWMIALLRRGGPQGELLVLGGIGNERVIEVDDRGQGVVEIVGESHWVILREFNLAMVNQRT